MHTQTRPLIHTCWTKQNQKRKETESYDFAQRQRNLSIFIANAPKNNPKARSIHQIRFLKQRWPFHCEIQCIVKLFIKFYSFSFHLLSARITYSRCHNNVICHSLYFIKQLNIFLWYTTIHALCACASCLHRRAQMYTIYVRWFRVRELRYWSIYCRMRTEINRI